MTRTEWDKMEPTLKQAGFRFETVNVRRNDYKQGKEPFRLLIKTLPSQIAVELVELEPPKPAQAKTPKIKK